MTDLETGLLVAAAIGIFLQAGAAVLALVFRNTKWPPPGESLSLAFGLGVGALASEMLIFSLLGVAYSLPALLGPWAAVWLFYGWVRVHSP